MHVKPLMLSVYLLHVIATCNLNQPLSALCSTNRRNANQQMSATIMLATTMPSECALQNVNNVRFGYILWSCYGIDTPFRFSVSCVNFSDAPDFENSEFPDILMHIVVLPAFVEAEGCALVAIKSFRGWHCGLPLWPLKWLHVSEAVYWKYLFAFRHPQNRV